MAYIGLGRSVLSLFPCPCLSLLKLPWLSKCDAAFVANCGQLVYDAGCKLYCDFLPGGVVAGVWPGV